MRKIILALFLFLICISQVAAADESAKCEAEKNKIVAEYTALIRTTKVACKSACADRSNMAEIICDGESATAQLKRASAEVIQANRAKVEKDKLVISICKIVSYWLDSDTKGQSEDALYEGLALLTFQSIYEIAECDTLNDKKTNAESDYWYGDD